MEDMKAKIEAEMDKKETVVPPDGQEMHPSLKKAREQQDAGPAQKITLFELLKR
jgi:hypothetical protein